MPADGTGPSPAGGDPRPHARVAGGLLLLVALALAACTGSTGSGRAAEDTRTLTLATAEHFTRALVEERFDDAHALLAHAARPRWPAESLARRYREMIAYGEGPAELDGIHAFLRDWPARRPGDIGWAYISIGGEDYAEAVAVVVTDEDGAPRVREIEWGRP